MVRRTDPDGLWLCRLSARLRPDRLPGAALRRALGLRSACFTLRYQDGGFCITTRGYGHGVGLSQWGAKALAEQGQGYADILAHYFPGTQLCR